MSWRLLYTVPLRFRSLFRRAQVEDGLDQELHFHLDLQTAAEVEKGRSPDEARSIALRRMGSLDRRKEDRDTRHMNLIDSLARDVRYGVRTLARSPGFSTAALLAIALGIGANTAMYSIVRGVMLRPLNRVVVALRAQQ